jgi:thermitase
MRKTLFIFPLLGLAVAGMAAEIHWEPMNPIDPTRIVVKYKPGAAFLPMAAASVIGAEDLGPIAGTLQHEVLLRKGSDVLESMTFFAQLPYVEWVQPNYYKTFTQGNTLTPNDPLLGQMYAVDAMFLRQAWFVTQANADIRIAVIDTGADVNHPDLESKIVDPRNAQVANEDPNVTDTDGHGTHVGGTAAAATNNGVGVAGAGFNAVLMPIKSNTVVAETRASQWAVDKNATIVNMSYVFFGANPPPGHRENMERMHNAGMLLIAAAGNSNTNNVAVIGHPAGFPFVMTVGSTDSQNNRSSFSNFGPLVDLGAPGTQILSTMPTAIVPGGYAPLSGTSMAAPNAAGVAALVWSIFPTSLTKAQIRDAVRNAMQTTTRPIPGNPFVNGRIDAFAAVTSLGDSGSANVLAPISISVNSGVEVPGTVTPPNVAILDQVFAKVDSEGLGIGARVTSFTGGFDATFQMPEGGTPVTGLRVSTTGKFFRNQPSNIPVTLSIDVRKYEVLPNGQIRASWERVRNVLLTPFEETVNADLTGDLNRFRNPQTGNVSVALRASSPGRLGVNEFQYQLDVVSLRVSQ